MHLSRYMKVYRCPDEPGKLLLYSTRKGATILVPESLLNSIADGTVSTENRDTLLRLGFLVPDSGAEKELLAGAIDEANRLATRFNAQVVLNLDCNLACTYCYEGGMKGKRYMSPETASLLAEMAEKRFLDQGKDVRFSYYGGEPLMSEEQIVTLSRRLQSFARERGRDWSFTMVTNGTLLTGPVVERLNPLGFSGAKITLDGPRDIHDRFRPFVSGNGSFDRIVANLKEVTTLTDIQVGGNYTQENYRRFPELLDHLLAQGLTPDRISLIKFDPVTKSGGAFPLPEFNEGCVSTDEPWLVEASLYLRDEILRRGYHNRRVGPSACMIESPDDLVVNWNGELFKCPAFLGWEGMSVGSLESGVGDYQGTHNLGVWKKEECLDCAYLPLCFGGCRFLTLLRNGRIDDVDCHKAFLDATLEEMVRQDLKYQPKRSPK